MKKIPVFLLAMATAASITSCAISCPAEDPNLSETVGGECNLGGMQIPNPVKSYSEPEEIATILGFTVRPFAEAENVRYSTISDDIAQVNFSRDGVEYTLRANDENTDFSGVYTPVKSEEYRFVTYVWDECIQFTTKTLTDGNFLITWKNSQKEIYYSLYVEGSPKNLESIVNEIGSNNSPFLKDEKEIMKEIPFEFTEIRTNAMKYDEALTYPDTAVITTKDGLNAYYEANKENFYLERVEKVYSDTTIGFLDEADKYDEEFFEENALILVVLENGSGSIRQKVTSVKTSDSSTWVRIKNIVPEICTDDMANWHLFITVPKAELLSENIEVVFEKF